MLPRERQHEGDHRVREKLLTDAEWRMILERPDDRNGWCVFCRATLADETREILAAAND